MCCMMLTLPFSQQLHVCSQPVLLARCRLVKGLAGLAKAP